jgi:hypothetical protein
MSDVLSKDRNFFKTAETCWDQHLMLKSKDVWF